MIAETTNYQTESGGSYSPAFDPMAVLQKLLAPPDANLASFYGSNPAYASEYQRVRGLGDQRNPLDWFKDFLVASPQDEAKYGQYSPPSVTPEAPAGGGFTDMIASVFNATPATNPNVTAPASVISSFLTPDATPDNSGILSQITSMFTALLGQMTKPSSTVTVAPLTNTNVDNRAWVDNSTTINDSSVKNSGFSLSDITGFMSRLPNLLSTPRGNDLISPSPYMGGLAQNFLQSGPRQSGQNVATVTGFDINASGVQIAGTALPWKTLILGAVISLGLFILYKKFFK